MRAPNPAPAAACLRPTLRVVAFRPSRPATVTLSPTWHYQAVSADAAELLGVTRARLLGGCVWDLYPGYAETPLGVLMRNVMETRIAGEIRTLAHAQPDRDILAVVRPTPEGGIAIAFRFVARRRPLRHMEATAMLPLSFLPWAMTINGLVFSVAS